MGASGCKVEVYLTLCTWPTPSVKINRPPARLLDECSRGLRTWEPRACVGATAKEQGWAMGGWTNIRGKMIFFRIRGKNIPRAQPCSFSKLEKYIAQHCSSIAKDDFLCRGLCLDPAVLTANYNRVPTCRDVIGLLPKWPF